MHCPAATAAPRPAGRLRPPACSPGCGPGHRAAPCCAEPEVGRPLAPWPPARRARGGHGARSEEHTSELQSQSNLVCRLLLEKKKKKRQHNKNNISNSI